MFLVARSESADHPLALGVGQPHLAHVVGSGSAQRNLVYFFHHKNLEDKSYKGENVPSKGSEKKIPIPSLHN